MSENKIHIKQLTGDLSWYLLGAVLPAVIGLIKNPIFTRYFTTEEYGLFNIAFITFDYLSVVMFSWLISCVWRYRLNYRKRNANRAFYSTVAFLYAGSVIFLLLAAGIVLLINHNTELRNLYILSALQVITGTLLNMVFILYRIDGKSKRYNLFNSMRVLLNFGLLAAFTFGLNMRTEAMFLNLIAVNVVFLLYMLIHKFSIIQSLAFRDIDRSALKSFFQYGFSGFVVNLSGIILISADRYILAVFRSMSEVGIYSVAYNLSVVSLMSVIMVFLNTVRPYLFDFLENKPKEFARHAGYYLSLFLILFVPLTVVLSVHSKQIAQILFAPEFQSGYSLLPYIFTAAFFNGLSMYGETQLKFENKLRYLVVAFVSAALLNVGLNFYFIPEFGGTGAAVTTVIAYLALFLILSFKTKAIFLAIPLRKSFLFIGLSTTYLIINLLYPVLVLWEFFLRVGLFVGLFIPLLFRFYKKETAANRF